MIEKIIYIGALVILALAQTIQFLIMRKNGKKTQIQNEDTTTIRNPNDKPGKAQICIDNGKLLERLKTQMEDVQGDIKDIFKRLNK